MPCTFGALSGRACGLERALQQPAPSGPARVKAPEGAIRLKGHLGDYAKFKALAQESLALCRSLGDRRGEAQALDRIAAVTIFEGELDQGMSLQEQSAAISASSATSVGWPSR